MLSNRETQILQFHSIGLTPDEIGDRLFISRETVRKTISNIKEKLHLQKATEIAGYYWCNVFGASFEERRKQILALGLLLVFILPSVANENRFRTRRVMRSRYRQEEISYHYQTTN